MLTCGSCGTTHLLAGNETVVAAEIATFVAAHRDHGDFRIRTDTAGTGTETVETAD